MTERADAARRVQNSVQMLRASAEVAAEIVSYLERLREVADAAPDASGSSDAARGPDGLLREETRPGTDVVGVIQGAHEAVATVHDTLETIADGLVRFYAGLLAVNRRGAGVPALDARAARAGAERLRVAVLREGGASLMRASDVPPARALELLAPPPAR